MAAMKITLPSRLSDDRVSLRPMVPTDAKPYAAAFGEDPDLGRLLGVEQDPDEQAVRERIETEAQPVEDRVFFTLAIADPVTDAFWGEVIVHSLHERHRRGELGFWVIPRQRQHGVGSGAVALTVSWLFDELDLLRVEMTTTPENPAVPALARRLGFTQEGILRPRNVERGRRVDLLWFGLLAEEWPGT